MRSRIVLLAVLITSTVSAWSSATYNSVWAVFSVILLGWPTTGIRALTAGASPIATTTISRSRTLDTYAVAPDPFPFTTTQNGYSPPGVPTFEGSLLPGRRSIFPGRFGSVPGSGAQWPRPPVNTEMESL